MGQRVSTKSLNKTDMNSQVRNSGIKEAISFFCKTFSCLQIDVKDPAWHVRDYLCFAAAGAIFVGCRLLELDYTEQKFLSFLFELFGFCRKKCVGRKLNFTKLELTTKKMCHSDVK